MNKILMPKLSDMMEEGKILNWIKQEGDTVKKGDSVAEVETEKVTQEIEAFASGVLRKILIPAGQSAPVGAEIALVGDPNEPLGEPASAPPAQAAAPERPQAQAAAGSAPLREAEARERPTGARMPEPGSGKHFGPEAERVTSSGAPAGGGNGRAAPAPQPVAQARPAGAVEGERIFISPIARRIAAEHNLDISQLQGTGPNGRIIREDVENALRQPQAIPAAPIPAFAPAPAIAAVLPSEDVRAVPLTQMRKTIARRLSASMQQAPHFYVTMAIDMTKASALRDQINDFAQTEKEPIKVSFNDLVTKAVARALTRMPEINVSFDGDNLLFKQHVNIGLAVALEQGLIVPVVRDVDRKGILEIARESRRLIDAAHTNKLKAEDIQGGTFSISNMGMLGVEEFTAVINPPESAILAVGAIIPTPVALDGQVVVRDRMKVTLSVDHRAIDGATAARFLQAVKRLLEEPMGILV